MAAPSLDPLTADPAAGLRAVAALIRERANAAQDGSWFADETEVYSRPTMAWVGETLHTTRMDQGQANATHIASFGQPAVALAIAAWLDDVAVRHAIRDDWHANHTDHATAVARAYLTGEMP